MGEVAFGPEVTKIIPEQKPLNTDRPKEYPNVGKIEKGKEFGRKLPVVGEKDNKRIFEEAVEIPSDEDETKGSEKKSGAEKVPGEKEQDKINESGEEKAPGEEGKKAEDKTIMRRMLEAPERVKQVVEKIIEGLKDAPGKWVENLENGIGGTEDGEDPVRAIGLVVGALGAGAMWTVGEANIPTKIIGQAALTVGSQLLDKGIFEIRKCLNKDKAWELDSDREFGQSKLQHFLYGVSAGSVIGAGVAPFGIFK